MAKRHFTQKDKNKAYVLFLDGYSNRAIAEKIGCATMTITNWSSEGNWKAAQKEISAKRQSIIIGKTIVNQTDAYEEMNEAYHTMLRKGIKALSEIEARTVKDAADLIDKGVKGIISLQPRAFEAEFILTVKDIIEEEVWNTEQKTSVFLRLRDLLREYSSNYT